MIEEIILPNAQLEERVKKVYAKSDFLYKTPINIIKMQAHFLSAVNDENRNILHLACHRGNLKLVEFITEKAGPAWLNIL